MITTVLVKKMLSVILAIMLHFGLISGVSTDKPITFKDSDNVNLSFCVFSDTHVRDDSFQDYKWQQAMTDIGNSSEKFDALVVTGDLADNGLKDEYDVFFNGIESCDNFDKAILSTGNHDMRFFYNINHDIIGEKQEEYLGIDLQDKDYYSYDLNGYTFIVLGTEKAVFERAYLSDAQLEFLDSELARATAQSNLTFVICHQPLKETHGLPGVWLTGDLGDQSDQVRAILSKYHNVIYLNGHLHDGINEDSLNLISDDVYSLNLPAFGKDNDYGQFSQPGLGYYVEVYDDEITFTGRDFIEGEDLGAYWTFSMADGLDIVDYAY